MGGRQDGDTQQDHFIRLDHRIRNSKIKSLPKRLDNWGTYTVGLEGRLQSLRGVLVWTLGPQRATGPCDRWGWLSSSSFQKGSRRVYAM